MDNTNTTVKIRAAWVELAKEESAEVTCHATQYHTDLIAYRFCLICSAHNLQLAVLRRLDVAVSHLRDLLTHECAYRSLHLPTLTYLSAHTPSSPQIRCVVLTTSKEVCFSLAALRLADPNTAPEDRREIKKVGAAVSTHDRDT